MSQQIEMKGGGLDLPFYEYVHKYLEITHSGIASPAGTLDPQFHEYHRSDLHKMTRALLDLARYAETSITAYRAIEWWSNKGGWMPPEWQIKVDNEYLNLPKMLIDCMIKPTTYYEFALLQKRVIE